MDKILKIQREIGKLSKDKENPFFHSSYFDLNQILDKLNPLLEKHGLFIIQPLVNIEMRPALRTAIYTSENSGAKWLYESTIPLPDLEDPQKMGSAITYYRRYALQSFFLLQAEDDDGEKARPKLGRKDYEKKTKD